MTKGILTLKRIYAEGLQQGTWEKVDIQKEGPMKWMTDLLAIFAVILCILSSPSITLSQEKPPPGKSIFPPTEDAQTLLSGSWIKRKVPFWCKPIALRRLRLAKPC